MQKIIVSVSNDLFTDQRVHKVCQYLHEHNYEVLLVGRLRKNSQNLQRDYKTHRMKLWFDKGPFFYAEFNIRLFFFLLFHKSTALLANDLDTLLANYLASKFKRKNTLYYDSHEYFTEVPELVSRPKIQKIWTKIEEFIFPKLENIYTVNQSIADKYGQKYNKRLKVVRNISPKWKDGKILSKSELGLPEDGKIIIFQGAGINIDRGAEEAVEAMKYLEGFHLVFVGDGDVVQQLKKTVTQENLQNKVHFYGKRPYQELLNFTYHADLGLTLDKSTNDNYKYSLPNKVFDYIHTSTPILASNVVEVKKLVEKYNIGKVIESHDPKKIAETIQSIFSDKAQYENYKQNCTIASANESWEKECKVLDEIYFFRR